MSADLHARLTAIILRQLETADPATWTPPWHGADPLPVNALTGRRYRGLNVLALWCAAQAHGYPDARWATYRQWAALGAQVRRGERGTGIVFYRDREPAADEPGTARAFVARASSVFNAAQVDGAPPLAAVSSDVGVFAPLPAFLDLVAATGARIAEGGGRACYVPATDTIHLPPRGAFRTPEGFAGTLAHELVHWTGAPHRLARDLSGRFGARAYAAEELVAELGAAFVLAEVGVARTPHPDHAAYMASWLPLLRADPHALGVAAAQGSRAASYLVALASPTSSVATAGQPEGPIAADAGRVNAGEPPAIPAPGGGVSAVPPPSARVLADLDVPALVRSVTATSTPLARAWADLARARETHAAALAALDRVEADLVAAHGYPRVTLPAVGDARPAYAADPATIARYLGRGPAARRLRAALRRRQRRYALAADAAGLGRAREWEMRTAAALGAATASLLLVPVARLAEARLKLAVLIASGEAGPPEAHTFP